MIRTSLWIVRLCVVLTLLGPVVARAAGGRLALVVGESAYKTGTLATTANDAGAVALALATAGFDVTGYSDLDAGTLRRAFEAFVGKARAAGPDALAVVYLAGYGLQFDGGNFIAPVDATIARDVDVPLQALALADFEHDLAAVPLKARVLIYDLARKHPFAKTIPLASGLAMREPPAGVLTLFNTAPGAVAVAETGLYGAFARALSDTLGEANLPLESFTTHVRVRAALFSGGALVPWAAGRADDATILVSSKKSVTSKPVVTLGATAGDAFWTAVVDDRLPGYVSTLRAFAADPLASRLRDLVAVRREAVTWAAARRVDKANAYWTYMRRYPRGPHFPDSRRRLAALSASLEPPPRFDIYPFADVEPPSPWELSRFTGPFVSFDDPAYAPLPPAPQSLIAAVPKTQSVRLPPLLAIGTAMLPLPMPETLMPGQITQPGFGGGEVTVTARGSADKTGQPVLTQSTPDGRVLSVAMAGVVAAGRRIVQTGPDGKPVLDITETIGPHDARTVVATRPGTAVLSTEKTVAGTGGQHLTTILGPDGHPRSIGTSNGVGAAVAAKDAALTPLPLTTALPRPTILPPTPMPPPEPPRPPPPPAKASPPPAAEPPAWIARPVPATAVKPLSPVSPSSPAALPERSAPAASQGPTPDASKAKVPSKGEEPVPPQRPGKPPASKAQVKPPAVTARSGTAKRLDTKAGKEKKKPAKGHVEKATRSKTKPRTRH